MNNFKLSKIHIINLTIIIIWIMLLWLNLITYTRLIIFLIVLGLIFIYRIIINGLKNSSFSIQNIKILKYILILNKIRNPVLLLLVKLDILMYDVIIRYHNIMLNIVIFILYLVLINPIKIFYYKMYKVLWIWKDSKMHNIVLNRMIGLILSILIFTNLIIYIKNALNINILIVVYLYCLIISVLCELIETRNNRWLNIFLVNDISTRSILANRHTVNILSVILKKSNIDETSFYIHKNIKNKIQAFHVGYLYFIIDSLKYLINKPSYSFYFNIESFLDLYLTIRIGAYIFFRYNEWDICLEAIVEPTDILKLKKIYEYDYKVFKVLLFLYWDLEYYLEGMDYVKNTLMVDSSDLNFLKIIFNNELKSEKVFLDKVKYKEPNKFWVDIESINNSLLKLDLFNKKINTEYNDNEDLNLQNYNLFDMKHTNVCTLRLMGSQIDPLYYENYIKGWYEEWKSEINKDLTLKYKEKFSILELDYQYLFKK